MSDRGVAGAALLFALVLHAPSLMARDGAVAAQAREPIARTAYFAFHSDPRYALYDALLAAARESRFDRADPYATQCLRRFSPEASARWTAAVREVGEAVESKSEFGEERAAVRKALVTGRTPTLESHAALTARVFDAMDGVREAWMHCHWPMLDAANRRWAEAVTPLLEAHEAPIAERLQALFEQRWRKLPIPVDLVGDAGWAAANTMVLDGGAHIQVRSTHVPYHGPASLEIVFHEASHELVGRYNGPIATLLRGAADDAGVALDDDLWHGLLFVSVGEVVEQRLRDAAGLSYSSIAHGVLRDAWGTMRVPLREHWLPVVRGESTRGDAARALVVAVAKAAPD